METLKRNLYKHCIMLGRLGGFMSFEVLKVTQQNARFCVSTVNSICSEIFLAGSMAEVPFVWASCG